MIATKKRILAVAVVGALIAIGAAIRTSAVSGQSAPTSPQAASAAATEVSANSPQVAAGTAEAMKLLRLMDTNKNGNISRTEYMAFMAAEFDRLDIDHNGELDIKELSRSQPMAVHHGAGHR